MTLPNPIWPLASDKIPSYIKNDYPRFHKFVTDYFKFLESDGQPVAILDSWLHDTEPSNEVEGYIDAILLDLGWEWGGNLTISKRLLLHTLREFYLSRGTRRSFEFLFATLFGQSVEIRYPRDKMFVTSDAIYSDVLQVFTSANNYDAQEYEKLSSDLAAYKPVTITGQKSKYVANVESIYITTGNNGERYFDISISDIVEEFFPGESVFISSESSQIVETVKNVMYFTVKGKGHSMTLGDDLVVHGANLNGVARVSSTSGGKVDSLIIKNAGSGYAVGDKIISMKDSENAGLGLFASVTAVGPFGEITAVDVINGGKLYNKYPVPVVKGSAGVGAEFEVISQDIAGLNNVKYHRPYVDFDLATAWVDSTAEITPLEKTIFRSKKHLNRRGFLAENCVLTDSYRYQQFSYDILSPVPNRYQKQIVDDLLHPVGYVRTSVMLVDIKGQKNITFESKYEGSKKPSNDYLVDGDRNSITTIGGDNIVLL